MHISSSGCAEQLPRSDVAIKIFSKDKYRMIFSIFISNELSVNNIIYENERNFNMWVLKLKKNGNFFIKRKNDLPHNAQLNINEYKEVFNQSLHFIKKEFPRSQLNKVQIDTNLVESVWSNVVDATKSSAQLLTNGVTHKNKKIEASIVKALNNSALFSISCLILRANKYDCEKNGVNINPISFNPQHLGKEWLMILKLPHAGLNEKMWFGINVTRLK